jgi:hypothetical protein
MTEPRRSPHWAADERAHLLVQPHCLCCGKSTFSAIKVNVHHKYPFHFVVALGRPDLERDPRNLFTLCVDHAEEHHLLIGHLDNWETYNPRLEYFLALCRGLTAAQIRSMPEWHEAVAARPKPLGKMTAAEKRKLRAELDRFMPLACKTAA